MSIHAPEYARQPPALRPRPERVRAIFWHGVRERVGGLNIVLLALIFIVVLLPLGFIFYFTSLLPTPDAPAALSLFFFPLGIRAWFFFLVLLTSSVGAAVIAGDLATRTVTLYLARPIEKGDYLAAKTAVVGFWMVLGATVPGVAGAVLVLSLGYVSLGVAVQAGLGYLAVGLLAAAAFTALAVLLSSLTARSTVAGAGIFGTLAGTEVITLVLTGISGAQSFRYASPYEDLLVVARSVFSTGDETLSPWVAAGVLVALTVGAMAAAYARLQRTEVVGE